MSRRGREGRKAWLENHPNFAEELTRQIQEDAARRQEVWDARGRLPWWMRAKLRMRKSGRPS